MENPYSMHSKAVQSTPSHTPDTLTLLSWLRQQGQSHAQEKSPTIFGTIMPEANDAFIPRIQSIFYAEFDIKQGPCIRYQVPEDLIKQDTSSCLDSTVEEPVSSREDGKNYVNGNGNLSRLRGIPEASAIVDPAGSDSDSSSSSSSHDPHHPESLFSFDAVSHFVIPKSEFCGRLVVCTTPRHRILGFPVVLHGRRYKRRKFRYNICFVFPLNNDTSCFEPIVRKVGRVLTSFERETAFLSASSSCKRVRGLLEQIFDDLNAFSETSIRLDIYNSLELKIFPYYPNPPTVADCQVPVPLINLEKKQEANWDLAVSKIIPHINGTNHIKRIADEAEVDTALVRQSVAHLLLYQCLLLIDIFQYSNIYCLGSPISWLANDTTISGECGPYVTKSGSPTPPWTTLLWLYSRLKPPKTVQDWMKEYNVADLGIDVRRFLTFGVIKGIIRRVHRWPILETKIDIPPIRKRSKSFSASRSSSRTPASYRIHEAMRRDHSPPPAPPPTAPPSVGGTSDSHPYYPQHPLRPNLQQIFIPSASPLDHFMVAPPPSPIVAARRISQASEVQQRASREAHSSSGTIRGGFHHPDTSTDTLIPGEYPVELRQLLSEHHNTDYLCTALGIPWQKLEQYLNAMQNDATIGRIVIVFR